MCDGRHFRDVAPVEKSFHSHQLMRTRAKLTAFVLLVQLVIVISSITTIHFFETYHLCLISAWFSYFAVISPITISNRQCESALPSSLLSSSSSSSSSCERIGFYRVCGPDIDTLGVDFFWKPPLRSQWWKEERWSSGERKLNTSTIQTVKEIQYFFWGWGMRANLTQQNGWNWRFNKTAK